MGVLIPGADCFRRMELHSTAGLGLSWCSDGFLVIFQAARPRMGAARPRMGAARPRMGAGRPRMGPPRWLRQK